MPSNSQKLPNNTNQHKKVNAEFDIDKRGSNSNTRHTRMLKPPLDSMNEKKDPGLAVKQ